MSPKSAGLAKKWGWNNVKVCIEGMPAWKKAGHYTVSTPDYVRTANIVLIDLRAPAAVTAGHIPRAVGIPAGKLAGAEDAFPESLTAPIVFYSDNLEESVKAVKTARGWRYKNVSLLEFPGAINISLDELPAKLDDIPQDKFVVVHCRTGVRGEMAYLLLKEKGFDVKYLKAGCKCKLDGTYLIWEM